ncbi:MAG: hypothetical protein ABIZ34_07810, partial [Candidatus Limnocylindrales bacterium]
MRTTSTASSSTDDPAEPGDAPVGDGADEADLGRRSFFRVFGRGAVQAVGQVAGAADALRRTTSAAASGLLELGVSGPGNLADRLAPSSLAPSSLTPGVRLRPGETRATPLVEPVAPIAVHRSPYRLDDDALILLDQRGLPMRFDEIECRDGRDVARAILAGAARGGPLLGQIAAYGLAMTAHAKRDEPAAAVGAELDLVARILQRADPSARAVVTAMRRLAAVRATLPEDGHVADIADALRDEADAIASEAALDHAALARNALALVPADVEGRVELLIHGPLGSMGSGLVATGLGVVTLLVAEERPVHVWLTEERPTLNGTRILAWELGQADVPHSIIPDSAVSWLLDREVIHAVFLAGEWVTASGDTIGSIGSGSVATLAASASPPVPVYVCAPKASFGEDSDAATVMDAAAARQPSPASRVAAI